MQFRAIHENLERTDIGLTMFQPNRSVVYGRGRCTILLKTTWVAHHSVIVLDIWGEPLLNGGPMEHDSLVRKIGPSQRIIQHDKRDIARSTAADFSNSSKRMDMKPILALVLKAREGVVHLPIVVTRFYAPQLAGSGRETWRIFDPVMERAAAPGIPRQGQL